MALADGWDWHLDCDLLVIGGGVAGLSAARRARELGLDVLIVDKGRWRDGARTQPRFVHAATNLAQGGIAVVGLPDAPSHDSITSHVDDTLNAGSGHCDRSVVESIVGRGADAVNWLIGLGTNFDTQPDGTYSRTREGGHTHRRILHAGGDATGAEIQRALEASVIGARLLQNANAKEILLEDGVAKGALIRDPRGLGAVTARKTVIATGGLGHLFRATTAPKGSLGDGHVLALDAGVELSDLEFIQFHPTVLFDSRAHGRRPLLTEALRGEGATLQDSHGRPVVTDDPRGDLASRDIVSRAIAMRLRETGEDNVFLDARSIEDVHTRFPTVTSGCRSLGLDPAVDLLPVAPAVHYSCGGIATDGNGATSVPGLYAAGECARTGLHGANRLASNSLLEGLVVGKAVAEAEISGVGATTPERIKGRHRPRLNTQDRMTMQAAMTEGAGVTRTAESLERAAEALEGLPDAGAVAVAKRVVAAAQARTETLGCHTRLD